MDRFRVRLGLESNLGLGLVLKFGIRTVYLIYAETTPRQREPRDAATDAETRTISDSIDRSLTRDTCDCDYCDYYDAERLMMIARHGNYWCSVCVACLETW